MAAQGHTFRPRLCTRGGRRVMNNDSYVVHFRDLTSGDVARVGGKNASLGELIRALGPAGIRVPPGFATTAHAYRELLALNDLTAPIEATLARFKAGKMTLAAAGRT